MSYDTWEKRNIMECLDKLIDYRGKTPKKSEEGILTLSAKSVKNSNIDYSLAYRISSDEYKKFMVRGIPFKGDILITTEAPMGQVAKLNRNGIAIAQRLLTLRPNPKILYNDYLLYYLQSPKGQAKLKARESGSTVTGIKQSEFRKIDIEMPPLSEQKAIANILSSLDDKIELNNKINKNLEEMAQALYKQWFVDFEFPNEDGEPYKSSGGEMIESELGLIPKGWEVNKLKVVIDIVKESTKPGETLKNRVYTPIDVLPRKQLIIDDYKSYEEAKSSLLLYQKYDILIGAMRVYFHRVNLAPFNGITRTTTFVIRGKEKCDVSFNLLTLNQDSTIEYANGTSRGSTMPYAIWENGLGEMEIAFPSNEIRKTFNELVLPMLDEMIIKTRENRRLSRLRDTLLPKLMSGEIEVPIEG